MLIAGDSAAGCCGLAVLPVPPAAVLSPADAAADGAAAGALAALPPSTAPPAPAATTVSASAATVSGRTAGRRPRRGDSGADGSAR
jgi:hypothetical protein